LVPVEFLTDEQVAAFGRFTGPPSRAELDQYFWLDDADWKRLDKRRGDHNRLGYALQMTTVRYLGCFLPDPVAVPTPVVDFLAEQLGVADASCIKQYAARQNTQWEHTVEIRAEFGYRNFSDPEASAELRAFLAARAWTRLEPSKALFDAAVRWLCRRRVLLPGVHALVKQVIEVRTAAQTRVWETIATAAAAADAGLPGRLDGLLKVPVDARISELERLRRGPVRVSGREMTGALDRASELDGLGAGAVDLSAVPVNRVETLARDGLTAKAPVLAKRTAARRTATLVATVRSLTSTAVDDALDLFGVLMATRLIRQAERATRDQKLAAFSRVTRSATTLAAVVRAMMTAADARSEGGEAGLDPVDAVAVMEDVAPRERLAAAVDTIEEWAPDDEDDDGLWRAELVKRFGMVRGFLELLAEVIPFGARGSGRQVLAAVRELPGLLGRKKVREAEIRPELVTGSWRRLVHNNPDLPAGVIDRKAYVLCVLEALWKALRNREVFAHDSKRWGDPHAKLLDGPAWEAIRPKVLLGLGLTEDADTHLTEQAATLDGAWRHLADRLGATDNAGSVRVEADRDGRAHIRLDRLDKLEEPPSLTALKELTSRMLPRVRLPELLLEVHARSGFLGEFTHAGGADARVDQLEVSMAAVLMSEACNFGYKPVTDPDEPALTRARLSHVDQNYLRADTIKAANARLILAQAELELARLWGGGLVASVDGLRFVVPVATVYAGHNTKYFGRRRGATWINAMNDQRVGTGAQVVPGTARDSLFTLDVMLNPDHGRRPEIVTSDTAGYSDLVFGLYRICGMQYAPRLADLTDTRFWRTTATADYGVLSDLARHRVRLERIRQHWPQMLKIAGSLVTGTVRAYDLIRALGRSGNPTPLGTAFAEYGRISKTQHLLAVCDPDDDSYRRGINAQQNQTESRHRLARKIFFGQRGELRQAYQEGMEDQLGSLGLVLNACVLWTTTYLDAALEQLRAQGYPVRDEDAARLSPFQDAHIDVHGRYSFAQPNLAGALRPLRDPTVPLDDDEEDERR
jgi:TnpA family transposase